MSKIGNYTDEHLTLSMLTQQHHIDVAGVIEQFTNDELMIIDDEYDDVITIEYFTQERSQLIYKEIKVTLSQSKIIVKHYDDETVFTYTIENIRSVIKKLRELNKNT
jgi:hypothetical protein